MGIEASNNTSESVHAMSTQNMQVFGTIRGTVLQREVKSAATAIGKEIVQLWSGGEKSMMTTEMK